MTEAQTITQNILVATDFSQAAEVALERAAILARQNHAKVTLVHVVEASPWAPVKEDPETGHLKVEEAVREKIHGELKSLADRMLQEAPGHKTALVLSKNAADGICHYAKKEGVDLIVISTHGRTGLGHLLIGSVAERVVRHAHCPVLTVRA
jgi:nucleotide-binding universal stress UspA family protein